MAHLAWQHQGTKRAQPPGCRLQEIKMTSTFHASAQAIRVESSLAILIARRNSYAPELRCDTRYAIRRYVGALRILRAVGV